MAFEIYNGTGNGTAMFTKLNEMWQFDSYDDTSGITATYGNAKFVIPDGTILRIYNGTTQIFNQEVFSSNDLFTIVKSESSIMLSWFDNNYIYTIIIGTLANADGTSTGKGIVFTDGFNNNSPYYMVAGTNTDSSISNVLHQTDVLTQLMPQVSMREGWIFNNAYRSLYDTSVSKRGLYMIGSDRFYISGRAAIKEE